MLLNLELTSRSFPDIAADTGTLRRIRQVIDTNQGGASATLKISLGNCMVVESNFRIASSPFSLHAFDPT